ncbi:diguanylate cyclase (GGDEF) domain-containing protein [Streptomyces sp. SceaMP-e96]|uniref:Sensor domain-containing diguanylate cyclase n=3 Tax=Streptomyces nigrescens TaxID=1920 RepID=A0A640TF80_STRNI|nr:sensor domain-containing diguanylate cyclase [Streptomyces libani subsp. libani]GGV90944.1 sensor domain-containing diguanylate cyclase [Streptomyces libani subsp. libani]SCK12870.1 diguanylate cyclase (GGDEF) domain-containing protein [Streptomyces sp. SceaMP-e96]
MTECEDPVTGEGDARLRAVVELAQAMAAAHTPRESAHAAALGVRQALGGSFAAISKWERELGKLRVLVNTGELAEGEEEFPDDESYPVHEFPEIVGFLHEQWAGGGEPSAWVETAEGPHGRPAPRTAEEGPAGGGGGNRQRMAALRRRGRGCCVVAPIVLHGRAWGELYVARRTGEPVFGRADADFASVLAAVTAAGIAQTERLAEARRLAFTDALTGLANRRAVDMRLDEALELHRRDEVVVSLVVCDLNGLKRVNDSRGHAVGDRLLERFGSVLSLCGAMLPGTLVARLGGDEFCLLAVGPPADEVVKVAGELCDRAGELDLGEGVAVGVASTGDPIGPVRSARRLFRLADAAQYKAKAARSGEPVIAGRHGGKDDPVVRLADAPDRRSGPERRRFRR